MPRVSPIGGDKVTWGAAHPLRGTRQPTQQGLEKTSPCGVLGGALGALGGPGGPRGPRALGAPSAPIGLLRCGVAPPVQGAAPSTKDWQRQGEKTQPIAPKTGRGRANRPRPQRQRSREAAPSSKDRGQGHRCSVLVHQRLAEAGYGVGRLTFL